MINVPQKRAREKGSKAQRLTGVSPPPLWLPSYCAASLKRDYDTGTGTTTPEQVLQLRNRYYNSGTGTPAPEKILRHHRSVSAGAVRWTCSCPLLHSMVFYFLVKKTNLFF